MVYIIEFLSLSKVIDFLLVIRNIWYDSLEGMRKLFYFDIFYYYCNNSIEHETADLHAISSHRRR